MVIDGADIPPGKKRIAFVKKLLKQQKLKKFGELKVIKCIESGSGKKAEVFEASDPDSREIFAAKRLKSSVETAVIDDRPGHRWRRTLFYYKRECLIWQSICESPCPNILPLLGYVPSLDGSSFPGLISPKMDYTMYTFLKNNRFVSRLFKVHLLTDVARGLVHLHTMRPPVVHRDISAQTILVSKDCVQTNAHSHDSPPGSPRSGTRSSRVSRHFTAYIANFGNSKYAETVAPGSVGEDSSHHVSDMSPPEYRTGSSAAYHNPTAAGDMWSFGCLILHVWRHTNPANCSEYSMLKQGRTPTKRVGFGPRFWGQVVKLLDEDPAARPTAPDMLNWLSSYSYMDDV